jgi:hypothetical protein
MDEFLSTMRIGMHVKEICWSVSFFYPQHS